MSNTPRRRRRGALILPRSAWPIHLAFSATPGFADDQVAEAIVTATRELESRLAGGTRRSEVRALAVDADEAPAVLDDLGVDRDAHAELRSYCAEHPGGRLVIAWADVEPNTRRITILGG